MGAAVGKIVEISGIYYACRAANGITDSDTPK